MANKQGYWSLSNGEIFVKCLQLINWMAVQLNHPVQRYQFAPSAPSLRLGSSTLSLEDLSRLREDE